MQASDLRGLLVCFHWCNILTKKDGNSLLSICSLLNPNVLGLLVIFKRLDVKTRISIPHHKLEIYFTVLLCMDPSVEQARFSYSFRVNLFVLLLLTLFLISPSCRHEVPVGDHQEHWIIAAATTSSDVVSYSLWSRSIFKHHVIQVVY